MKKLLIVVVVGLLGGCASSYPCGEPSAGSCRSVSQNYKNSYTNYTNPDDLDKPGMFGGSSSDSSSSKTEPIKMGFTKYPQLPADGAPLLSTPKMIRVWLTPYTDDDNIYHDQSYEYIIVDKGHWNYGNNKAVKISGGLKNVSAGQVTMAKDGYGSFGIGKQPQKPATDTTNMPNFPALNALQHNQQPTITEITGIGAAHTTTISP